MAGGPELRERTGDQPPFPRRRLSPWPKANSGSSVTVAVGDGSSWQWQRVTDPASEGPLDSHLAGQVLPGSAKPGPASLESRLLSRNLKLLGVRRGAAPSAPGAGDNFGASSLSEGLLRCLIPPAGSFPLPRG